MPTKYRAASLMPSSMSIIYSSEGPLQVATMSSSFYIRGNGNTDWVRNLLKVPEPSRRQSLKSPKAARLLPHSAYRLCNKNQMHMNKI